MLVIKDTPDRKSNAVTRKIYLEEIFCCNRLVLACDSPLCCVQYSTIQYNTAVSNGLLFLFNREIKDHQAQLFFLLRNSPTHARAA
jgi:hypothetical protein